MNLKDILYRKKIKQVELAKMLGIDPSRISLFINGRRPLPRKYHAKLAEILSVSAEALEKMPPLE